MNNDNEMSLQEAEQWLKQNTAELLQKASRQAANHLAKERAEELARPPQTAPVSNSPSDTKKPKA